MREMKDSGIPWVGAYPSTWTLTKIKYIAKFNPSVKKPYLPTDVVTYAPMDCIRFGNIEPREILVSTASSGLTYFEENDILMAKVTPCFENGNIAIAKHLVKGIGLGSSELFVFRANPSIRYWLFYFLQNEIFKNFAVATMTGTGGLKRVSPTFVSNYSLALPSKEERQGIVEYLDKKCAQIDTLITNVQSQNEKLKAYKQSLITEVVTKGLDPTAPMKDSGVDWMGEIPVHWDLRRIKTCCQVVDCKNRTPDPDPDGEYTVVRTTCIRNGSFSYDGSYLTNKESFTEWTAKGAPRHGDIFFTREAPMGEACLVPNDDRLCMGQRVMFFRPFSGFDCRFILYSIYGPLVREYIESKNKGSTVGHLKLGQVSDLPLLTCPYHEQIEIADYLDDKCKKIDRLISIKQAKIDKLNRYKKSLIYEYVTGKKEV